MRPGDIEQRICKIVAEVSGQKGIDRSDHLVDDLGMDDTQVIEVICRRYVRLECS